MVGALDDLGLAGLTVRASSGSSAVSETSGQFALSAVPAGLQTITVSGTSIVTRRTGMTAPGTDVTVSIIPAAFDLSSFDQMMRSSGRLQRWTSAPRLVIVAGILQFTATGDNEFVALDQEMSTQEVDELTSDLVAGLAELSGGQLGAFAEITVERPAAGTAVLVKREGAIVVARHKGLTAATTYWGYGRWATTTDGEVVGGIVFLDLDFENSGSAYRQSLRIHELGHALGYNHVTRRTSVMNSSARYLPNDFDRESVRIAFRRPPGNTTPDIDPTSYSANAEPLAAGRRTVTWGPWVGSGADGHPIKK